MQYYVSSETLPPESIFLSTLEGLSGRLSWFKTCGFGLFLCSSWWLSEKLSCLSL